MFRNYLFAAYFILLSNVVYAHDHIPQSDYDALLEITAHISV